ncbi:MAG: hypothetical protein PHG48_08015 [Eubacteriales bacterium]|nr:hypothetical protein [Eubacteriales bacterium]
MDFKTYDFIVEKYSKLIQAQELLNNYYLDLAKQIKEFMCNNNKLTFSEGEVQINTELKPWYNIDLNGVKMDLKPIKIDFCKNKIYHFWYLLINPQGRMAFQYYVNYLPEYNKERIINEVRKKGYTKIYDTERNGKLISIIPVFEKYCTFEEAKKYAEEVLSVYKGIFDGLYNK